MSTIAFIPIDNRPVCYNLPKMIIKQDKQHNILLPDINLLGNLKKAANMEELFKWLEGLENIDIYVTALDTLAYGGLISSRRNSEQIEIILNRINYLVEILKKKNSKIYAYSSIMRISNNNINEEEKEYWKDWGKKIFEYSYNFHKKGILKTDIPKDILDDYLETRKRNLEINKYYIELKKQGIFDTLVFSKDDCAKFGLNVLEAKELEECSNGIKDIFVKTGADEIGLTLLSRAINKDKKIKIFPMYNQPGSIEKISKYEDITVKQSVESQIELSGGILSDEENCDIVLLVNNFLDEQGELVMDIEVPLFNKKLNLPNKPYLIADILNANGSDNNFVNKLLKEDLKDFYGYAGWNTTGNTLGSVLSGGLTYYKSKEPSHNAFKELQIVRFLDDWGYQANVRGQIRSDISNLSNDIVKIKMKEYEGFILNKFLLKRRIDYYFPCNRFFEIGILIQ